MKITEVPTKIYRGRDFAWEGRTIRTEKGQTFEITTMKRYNGHLVTTASKVEASESNGFTCISMGSMMDKPFMSIDHGKIKCTENVVKNAHFEALAAFDVKVSTMPESEVKNEAPEVGDIIFLCGYGKDKGSHGNNWIIFEVMENGRSYKCIEKDTLLVKIENYISDYKKRRGQTIGMYFEKSFNMSTFGIDQNKLNEMLIDAVKVAKAIKEKQRIENEIAVQKEAEKKAYLAQFIQADRRKTTNIIKSHCLKTWPISKIEVVTDVYSMGSSMDVKYYSPEKIDELESFIDNFQYGHFNGMEDMYEYSNSQDIIIDGHILQQYKYASAVHVESDLPVKNEAKKQPETELFDWDELLEPEKTTSDIQIIDYSEKAVAVIGEGTKRIKDELKALGGRFNFRLSCGAGWIFPTTKKAQILQLI